MSVIHPAPEGTPTGQYWSVGKQVLVGRIIDHNGAEVESLLLKPQGIAHVISHEPIVVPEGYCAFAHVLTRRCSEGLLTLNIGVIDPGWNNYISTPILNFSAEPKLLQKEQPFMRLTFHKIELTGDQGKRKTSENFPYDQYAAEVKERAAQKFGKYFLNVRALVAKATEKETQRIKETSLKYLPVGAFGLAFFALMVTAGTGLTARLAGQPSNSEIKSRLDALDRRVEIDAQIVRRLDDLETRLNRRSQPVGPPKGNMPSGKNPSREARP